MEEIIQYLEGKMKPEEQAAFERRLEQDEALKAQVEEELKARVAVFASAYQDRKAQLVARPIVTATGRSLNTKFVIIAAAAAAVLLLALVTFQLFQKPPTAGELYAQYYQEVPFSGNVRGGDSNPFAEAQLAYSNRDFREAAQQFSLLLADTSFTLGPKAYYFRGISYLELAEWEQAIASLQQVSEGALYGPAARWHMALAYLKIGQIDSSKAALQQLIDSPIAVYQTKAQKLLEQLNQYP